MKTPQRCLAVIHSLLSGTRLALGVAILFAAPRLRADSAVWTGGDAPNNPSWNNLLNWSNNIVPANPLTFSNYNTLDGAVTFDSPASYSVDSYVPVPWSIGRVVITTNAGNYNLYGSDLTLAQAQSGGASPSIDFSGGATITISNNLIFPVATNNPASNIRHQLYLNNAGILNLYGNLIKSNAGPCQLTFRGGGSGAINVYGAVLWDTNTVSKTDNATTVLYNSGNTWTNFSLSVGTVRLGVANGLPTNSRLDFNQNSTATFDMNDNDQTLLVLANSVPATSTTIQGITTGTNAGGTLTLNDNGTTNTWTGRISGNGRLVKNGNGNLSTTNQNNTYTGGTTLNGGIFSIGTGGTGGAIVGNITNNALLVVNKTDALTLAGTLSGSGSLRKLATGTLTLTGTNSYAGTTSISNGTVLVNGLLTGPGAINVYGGALGGTGSLAGAVTVFTNAQIQTTVAPLPGTLTLQNNLTLNSGGGATYKFGGPTTVGGGANDLFDIKGNLTLNNNPLTLVPVAPLAVGNTYRIANVAGALTGNFGTLTNNTHYGFSVSASGGQVNLTVTGGGSTNLTWSGTNANWDLTTANWLNGASRTKFFQADTALFDDTATNFNPSLTTVLYPNSVTVNTTNTYIFSGSGRISGGSLTKTGPGTVIMSNANDFVGPVTINNGIFKLANATALGSILGGTFVTNTGTLDLGGVSLNNPGEWITIAGAGLSGTGAVINTGADQQGGVRFLSLTDDASIGAWNNRWDVRGPGGNASFSGVLDLGGHTLTKLGTNKTAIADVTATNAGSIEIANGVLAMTRSLVDGPGYINIGTNAVLQIENSSTGYVAKPIIASGGTLQVVGNAFTLYSPITNASGLTVNNSVDLTLTNTISGTGALTKVSAGALTLAGANTYAGPTTVSAGRLALATGASLPNTVSLTVASNAVFDASLAGGITLGNGRTLSGSGFVYGDVTADPGSTIVPGSSAGTLNLGNNATFNSSTLNMELGSDPSGLTSPNDLIVVSGNLALNGVTTVKIMPQAALDSTTPYNLIQYYGTLTGGAANLNVVTDSRYKFALIDPAGTYPNIQVQVSGGGTAASLVWRGGDAANPGVWDFKTTSNWLNGASADVFFSGDKVSFDDTGLTNVAALTGTLAPAAVILANNAVNYTFGGSGGLNAGSFTNSGTAGLTVANGNANAVNFGFEMDAGSVSFVNAGANTLGGDLVMNNGALGFANNGANSFGGPITFNGGALAFGNNGPNSFGGQLILNAGTLTFTNAGANNFGPGPILYGGTMTFANPAANNLGTSPAIYSLLQFAQPVDTTVNSAFTGSGTLAKQATNTLTLSGNNSGFNGSLLGTAGTVRSGAANALGTGTVTINSGATLEINGQNCFSPATVTVQGTGATGLGAILNSGADQQSALKNVVLAGDTTVGGTGRWDVRGAGGSGSFSGILDLAGHTLTKLGANKISIADSTTPNDGPIVLLSGTLTFTRSTISGSAPIIVGTNLLQFENNTTGLVSKPIVADHSTLQVVGNSCGITSAITNNGGVTVDVASGLTFSLSNTVSGPGTLTKITAGTLALVTSNTFTGATYLQGGTLQLADSLAVGSGKTVFVTNAIGSTGGNGATVDLLAGVTTPSDVALAAGTSYNPDIRASLRAAVGTAEWKGAITLSGDGRFGLFADATNTQLTVSGPLTGTTSVLFVRGASGLGLFNGPANFTGQFFKTDTGTWQVNSTGNVWTTTGIAVGTVRLGADDALCVTAPLTMGQGDANACVLDLNGHNQTVPSLANTGTGTRRIGNDSTNTDSVFTFNGSTNVSTYAGQFVDNVTTNGTKKLALTLASGTLYLNGVNSNTGPTTVRSNATLGGTGVLASPVTVNAGGTLAAGTAAIGRLSLSNNLVFASGSTNVVKINAASATNDMIVGLSSVTYAGSLVITNLAVTAPTNGTSFKLFGAAVYAGAFDQILPTVPGAGLKWDTSSLVVDGTLKVAASVAPQFTSVAPRPDGNFTLTISGAIGQSYSIRASEDVALPAAAWPILQSGTITVSPFTYDDLEATNHPQRFYLISVP